tara:strand:- start:10968 stop:12149 length:1182 start_codon:yes stop_codon:yes gene_type:complete
MTERKTLFGDGYSDRNTYSAILFFKDHGFLKSNFLPMHNYTETRDLRDATAYTHYPALPDILSASYAFLFATEQEWQIRIIPIFLSIFMLFVAWHTLKIYLRESKSLYLSFISLVLSNYYISFADNLHKHIYEEFFKWIIVWALIVFYKFPERYSKAGLISLLAICFFLVSNASFEPIVFIAVFVVGMSWTFKRRIFTPLNFFLGFITISAFVVHFYQVILYYGDFNEALADFSGSLSHRTLGKDNAKNYFTWIDFLQNPFRPINRMERMFIIPGWAYIIMLWFGLKKIFRENKEFFGVIMSLLAASYAWYLVMPQHAFIHPFTVRQFGIFIIFTTGISVIEYLKIAKEHFNSDQFLLKFAHSFLALYVIAMFLTQHVLQAYLRFGFLHGSKL